MTLLDQATKLYSGGRLDEALRVAQNGLAIEPQNEARLCEVAAASAHALGDHALAEKFWRQAIALKSKSADTHYNLGIHLANTGREAEAEQYFSRATALNPRFAEAYLCLGRCHANSRRTAEAEKCFRKALQLDPRLATAHFQLGLLLFESGGYKEAENCYRRAAALDPQMAEAFNNLGDLLSKSGREREADECFRRAITLAPAFAEAYYNLGNLLKDLGRLGEAEASYRRALQIKPDYHEVHGNLGVALSELGRRDEAEDSYRRALQIKPDYPEAHNNLGMTLSTLGRLHEAEASFRRALQIKPDFHEAYNNLGNTLKDLGRLDEAEASYRRALQIKPDFFVAYSSLFFMFNHHPDRSAEEIFSLYRQFDEQFGRPLRSQWRPHRNVPDQERRLRVGYVSGDFRDHSVAFFIEPVLENHDRKAFEVFCYHNTLRADAVTERLKTHADHWRDIGILGDDALATLIRSDLIDILVDLSGHTAKNRLLMFARKPAPVQATWLGYLNTTGLQAMDYWITDSCASPEGMIDDYHSERLIRLPNSQWCYRPPIECPETERMPKATSNPVTFAAFTTPAKINLQVITLWSRLLALVPGSRLLVVTHGWASVPTEYLERFTRHGIPTERLQLMGSRPFREYLSLHNTVDVVLDTFPYTGGTTTCHALWMGVPVVSLAGRTATSRGGASLLRAIGLGELVAKTQEEYLEIAAGLARDTDRLAAMRSGLRERMRASPLMDAQCFTRDLEGAYRAMWRTWCDSRLSAGQ